MFRAIYKMLRSIFMRFDPAIVAADSAMQQRLDDLQYEAANDAEIWNLQENKPEFDAAIALRETDPEASFSRLLALAENGSVWSMLLVARAYRTGNGVAQDPALDEEWLRRAAEQGSDRAVLNYCRIVGRQGNVQRCIEICRLGAARGWAPALYWLARYQLLVSPTRKTLKEVYPLMERAAAKGDLHAERFVAREMLKGRFGIRRIPEGFRRTIVYFKKLAIIYNELPT